MGSRWRFSKDSIDKYVDNKETTNKINALEDVIELNQKHITVLNKVVKKIKRKGKKKKQGENILQQVVEAQVIALRRIIENSKGSIELQEDVLKLLEGYKYDADEKEFPPTVGTFSMKYTSRPPYSSFTS